MEGGVGMVVVQRFLVHDILIDNGKLDVAGASMTLYLVRYIVQCRSNVYNTHDYCSLLRSAGWCDGRGFPLQTTHMFCLLSRTASDNA